MNIAAFAVLIVALQQPAPAIGAQSAAASASYAPVPFGPGERMTYKVSLGRLKKIGQGTIEVAGLDTVHGFPVYQLRMGVKGGILLAKVEDTYMSWLDVQSLISRRFHQDVHEVSYDNTRTFEFFPAERLWRRTDKDESGVMPTDQPLDDLSFLYFARTLPLEVGKTYTLPRYFKESGNPVTIKVLRRDSISSPSLGKFATIVVRPVIRTKGLFGEGGEAEVHFTDDNRRIPVRINTKVKHIGTMTLQLERYEPGTRVSPQFSPRSTSIQ
jgi:hypothetical protein